MPFLNPNSRRGKEMTCICIQEPRGRAGLEGYNLGSTYKCEHMTSPDKKPYYRVYPEPRESGYYEICGPNVFKEHFKVQKQSPKGGVTMPTIRIYNIDYDTDGDIDLANDLPKILTLEADTTDEDAIEAIASDYISDTTGFCHFGFEWEIIK